MFCYFPIEREQIPTPPPRCTTPTGGSGKCMDIQNCPILLADLGTLRKSVSSFFRIIHSSLSRQIPNLGGIKFRGMELQITRQIMFWRAKIQFQEIKFPFFFFTSPKLPTFQIRILRRLENASNIFSWKIYSLLESELRLLSNVNFQQKSNFILFRKVFHEFQD